jgi:selenoprotein W-related protein
LADEIKKQLGETVELIKGRDGVFEICVDGRKVFSKKETGRFPEPGEAERAVAQSLAS